MAGQDTFGSLVRNAIDFFRRAAEELESRPKYSVIHFCAAAEIILKARLMSEHWSLIIAEPKLADLTKFERGDFQSVTMGQSIERLHKVASVAISKEAQKSLSALRDHRNKLIHFYNKDYIGKPTSATIAHVVSEQCTAWFHLHELMTVQWAVQFSAYQKSINKIDAAMHSLRPFLGAKFRAIKSQIKNEQSTGVIFRTCLACGFNADRHTSALGPLMASECLVCRKRNEYLLVPCPECGEKTVIDEYAGGATCKGCHHDINMDVMLDLYGEEQTQDHRQTNGPPNAYCGSCEYFQERSVVPIEHEWLCLSCLCRFDHTSTCEWCNEPVAGLNDDSYHLGCMMCDGHAGHVSGRDD